MINYYYNISIFQIGHLTPNSNIIHLMYMHGKNVFTHYLTFKSHKFNNNHQYS